MAENPNPNDPSQPAVASEAAPAPGSSRAQYGYVSPDMGAQAGSMGYSVAPRPRSKKRLLLIILGVLLILCLLLGSLVFVFRKNSKISAIISSTSNVVGKATGKSGSSNGSSKSSGTANTGANQYSDTPTNNDPAFLAQTAKTLATGDPAPVAVQFINAMKNADDGGVNKLLSPSALKKAQLNGSSLATYCKNKGNACIGVFKAYTPGLTATVTNTSTSNGAVAKLVSYTVISPAGNTVKTPMRLSIILIPAGPSWLVSDFKLGS